MEGRVDTRRGNSVYFFFLHLSVTIDSSQLREQNDVLCVFFIRISSYPQTFYDISKLFSSYIQRKVKHHYVCVHR